MDLNNTRFQHTLFKNLTVQQMLVGLIKNFGVAEFLHGVAAAIEQIEREKREKLTR